jgi:hypothetical protein
MTLDAAVIVHEWRSSPEADRLDVEHTGYARFDPPVSHRRTFVFNKAEGIWEITDRLIGQGEHIADWYFHFDAGIALTMVSDGVLRTRCEGTNVEIAARSEIPVSFKIEHGWVSHQYGRKLPAQILHMSGKFNSACRTSLTIRIL